MYGYLIGLTPTRLSGTGNRRWGGKSKFKVEPFNTVHTHCAPSQPNTPYNTLYTKHLYSIRIRFTSKHPTNFVRRDQQTIHAIMYDNNNDNNYYSSGVWYILCVLIPKWKT